MGCAPSPGMRSNVCVQSSGMCCQVVLQATNGCTARVVPAGPRCLCDNSNCACCKPWLEDGEEDTGTLCLVSNCSSRGTSVAQQPRGELVASPNLFFSPSLCSMHRWSDFAPALQPMPHPPEPLTPELPGFTWPEPPPQLPGPEVELLPMPMLPPPVKVRKCCRQP